MSAQCVVLRATVVGRGHFNKLLYEDFGVYIEQIVVRSERVVRAPRLSDNLLYANRKPKDYKSA